MDSWKYTVAILLALTLASPAAADWTINDLEDPLSQDFLSQKERTIQLVNLTDNNNDPVAESDIDVDYSFNFSYNGSSRKMEHLTSGYWYANFSANTTGGNIEYEFIDNSPTGGEINTTESFSVGNLSTRLLTDFSSSYAVDGTIDVKINATDEWNDTYEDNADVDFYITNGSWTSTIEDAGTDTGSYWKYSDFDIESQWGQLAYGSRYVFHANATYSGAAYDNANGSTAAILKTEPRISGEIDYLNTTESNVCNNNSFFSECQRGAGIETGFNVTRSSAEHFELDIYHEENSGDWNHSQTLEMSKSNGLYTDSFDFPDLNTSKYSGKVILRYNATTSDGRTLLKTRNITSRSYRIEPNSDAKAAQGGEQTVKFSLVKYFSYLPLGSSRFKNATVEVTDTDGNQVENFTLSDMSYSSSTGNFRKDVSIASDADTGSYSTDIEVFNIYGEMKTATENFVVEDVTATFNTTDLDVEINKTGVTEFNLTLHSKISSNNTIEPRVGSDLENFTTVNDGENVSLSGNERKKVEVEFNLSRVEDKEGEIKFIDSDGNYNATADIEITAPSCDSRNDTLCLQGTDSGWENVSHSTRENVSRAVDLLFLGDREASVTVDTEIKGNISDYIELNPSSVEMNESNDEQGFEINFSVETAGYFKGRVVFSTDKDEVHLWTKLNSTVEQTDTGVSTVESLDLGYLPEGETVEKEIWIENTGDVEITDTSVLSSAYTVSIPSNTIEAGENVTTTLTLKDVESSSGSVTLTAGTSEGDVKKIIDIEANPVIDLKSKASELRDKIQSLTEQTNSTELRSRLNQLSSDVTAMESDYEAGNYQEAQKLYDSIQNELNSIESQLSSSGTTEQQEEVDVKQDQGGGAPLLPLAIGLLVVLVVGFVAATSVELEPGDPLYDYLGGS